MISRAAAPGLPFALPLALPSLGLMAFAVAALAALATQAGTMCAIPTDDTRNTATAEPDHA
ncbi:hypothetical protein SAMN05446589_9276 [Streptomyces sp. OV198]|jgi:hypothetical protein|nr:hypothetical protein OK006_9191 [Actinobacteria bacterium OK006]SOF02179.1 hypothetical protein SAMN05446589_9276 [Streptomyces sp. OV198]